MGKYDCLPSWRDLPAFREERIIMHPKQYIELLKFCEEERKMQAKDIIETHPMVTNTVKNLDRNVWEYTFSDNPMVRRESVPVPISYNPHIATHEEMSHTMPDELTLYPKWDTSVEKLEHQFMQEYQGEWHDESITHTDNIVSVAYDPADEFDCVKIVGVYRSGYDSLTNRNSNFDNTLFGLNKIEDNNYHTDDLEVWMIEDDGTEYLIEGARIQIKYAYEKENGVPHMVGAVAFPVRKGSNYMQMNKYLNEMKPSVYARFSDDNILVPKVPLNNDLCLISNPATTTMEFELTFG